MAEWGDFSGVCVSNSSEGALRPSATTLKPLAEGTPGTFQTLGAMRDAVTIGLPPEYISYKDNSILGAALGICAGGGKACGEVLYIFARDYVSYIDHPWNCQVVQDATRTLEKRTGDCVSKSVLLATLLASLGITSRFVAQASTPEGGFDHVYVESQLSEGSGAWTALDPTADGIAGRPKGKVGWSQTLADGGFEMSYSIF